MDRLSELQALVQVGRSGSFTAAAETLGLTPSAISKQVRGLEDRLAVRLVNRTTRRVSLTAEGRVFVERAASILEDFDDLELAVTSGQERPSGTLRVSLPNDFGRRHLLRPLADFAARYPDVRLDVEFGDRFVDVVDEGFDVAVRIGEATDSSLIARRIGPCRRVVCAAPSYLERHGRPSRPADLMHGHTRLAFAHEVEQSWRFDGPEGSERVTLPIRHRTNTGEQLRVFAVEGEGLIRVPTFLVTEELRSGALARVLGDYAIADLSIMALYPHRRHLSARVRVFVDAMAALCGDHPYWDRGLEAIP